MSVLSRLESAQRVDVAFREVVRNEAEALMGVVSSAVTMELRRLGRAHPGLSEWAYEALAIISEFVPVNSVSLSVDVEGVPPVWMGFGSLVESTNNDVAASWISAPQVKRASVTRQLMADGAVVGRAALIAGSSALNESILVDVLEVLESELPAVIEQERRLRACASERIAQAAGAVAFFDDVTQLEELAQALAFLPSTVGVSIVGSSVISIEPIRIKVGSVATAKVIVERLVVGRGVLEIAAHLVDDAPVGGGNAAVHGDAATIAEAVGQGLRTALEIVERAVDAGEHGREQLVAADIGGPNQIRLVVEHALMVPPPHSSSVMVSVVELNEAAAAHPSASTVVDRLVVGLSATRPPSCVGRIDDRIVVLGAVLDELEAKVLADDLIVAANATIKPRGLAPRIPKCQLAFAVSPVHGDDPDTLMAFALVQLEQAPLR
jgi:hypothetical protein